MICIDTLWLCTQPQDMRSGADRLLHVVINTVGQAKAHQGQLFPNARASRIKLLVHDGSGGWCATRRLHAGRFVWLDRGTTAVSAVPALQLTAQQFEALAVWLPWQRLDGFSVISRC
ncbi:MAG: IS66 family insertion sequence element accessory protein TnpB [Acidovorax sp.]